MNTETILHTLQGGKQPVITVFGDFCLDKYLYIDAERDELSVETDLVAYQVTGQKLSAGGAGTVVNNLCALGAAVRCVGILGDDGDGFELQRCLSSVGADVRYMITTPKRVTCTYVKPMRCENGTETEMNRQDIRNFTKTPVDLEDTLLSKLESAADGSDAVIICDQFVEADFETVTSRVRDGIGRLSEIYGNVIFYADSRGFIDRFTGCVIKCNHKEIARIYSADEKDVDADAALNYAERLFRRNGKPVIVTLGENGSVVFDGMPHKISAFHVEGPLDIVGAGDACNAGTVFGLSMGLDYAGALLVGNAASSIVIKQIGTTGTADLKTVTSVLGSI